MKITRIEIKDFQQFKDFTLDLTYPAGHPKAGEPLDKVCFIGQSGTGKTTILNVISDLVGKFGANINSRVDNEFLYKINFFMHNQQNKGELVKYQTGLGDGYYNNFDFEKFALILSSNEDLLNQYVYRANSVLKSMLLYIQTGLENHIEAITQIEKEKPLLHTRANENVEMRYIKDIYKRFATLPKLDSNDIFDNPEFRWFLLKRLEKYDTNQKNILNNLFNKALNQNVAEALQEVQKWKLENPNPRIEISEKLCQILDKFNVKLDTDWADGGLKLKTLQDEEFDLPFASTGTKQILLSALLLMEMAHKVILFDEPERSLYPDIQRELIDFYTNIAPEAQFFFATHSPLIASQFEPWEIIELKFDEKTGKVYQEDYVKKGMERHIDNYRFYPKYMRWDSILTELYDLDADGNEEREQALQELAQASADIKYYKAQGDTEKVADLVKTYKALANKLLWKINEND